MATNKVIQIRIPPDLHARAKSLGINISVVCRQCIRRRIKEIELGIQARKRDELKEL